MKINTVKSDSILCWICGAKADTGEHMIKASDLKSVFGHVSQHKPLYFNTSFKRNLPIKGLRSDHLKHSVLICANCNNKITQPYDLAWQKLSEYFRTKKPALKNRDKVRLDSKFPWSTKQSMLDVHLFFIKQFGCLIVENKIPIDINTFSKAILNRKAHPKVFLSFTTRLVDNSRRLVGSTPVYAALINNQVMYATWFYILDKIAVNIIYSEPTEKRIGLIRSWHPSRIDKKLYID